MDTYTAVVCLIMASGACFGLGALAHVLYEDGLQKDLAYLDTLSCSEFRAKLTGWNFESLRVQAYLNKCIEPKDMSNQSVIESELENSEEPTFYKMYIEQGCEEKDGVLVGEFCIMKGELTSDEDWKMEKPRIKLQYDLQNSRSVSERRE